MTAPAPTVPQLEPGLRIEVLTSVHQADPADWDEIVDRSGGGLFHSHAWLSAFEQAPPADCVPVHLLARQDGLPVGLCPAYLYRQCPRLDHLISLGVPPALDLDGPVLLAHSLAALEGGPLALPGHEQVLDHLTVALEQTGAELGAVATGIANLPSGPLAGRLLGRGHAMAQIATRYLLPITWATRDAYWSSHRSRRRRSLLAARRAQPYRVSREPVSSADLVRLVHGLLAERGTPADVLPAPFLTALERRLRYGQRFVTARDEDEHLTAAFATWSFGNRWSSWLAGLDAPAGSAFAPYHALLSELVEYAVDEGAKVLDLGRANGAVKRRYGALPQSLLLTLTSHHAPQRAALHRWCLDLQRRHRAALNGLETTSRCC